MDTVGDFLTVIRNGMTAKHETVDMPASKIKAAIAGVLEKNSYISSYKIVKDGKQGMMRVYLKYTEDGKSVIENIQRASTPGRRSYAGASDIPKVRNGYGLAIMSTNKGILSDREARKQKVGGEILCTVW